ncbi:lycopene cyclase family protein [Streptomyces sp. Ru87]|uniref:lycopene cyclase family protein n=1 Tax=Streptomyces sp. Ru87 TaxID=2044307 RepID=UPI00211D5C06|nr:lycopene cyclase family protein [Streptomyces sp. Ru87]
MGRTDAVAADLDVDVAVIGAGAAGLSLLAALSERTAPDGRPWSVACVDPGPGAGPGRRTWCFWEPAGGRYDRAVAHSWRRLRVVGPGGAEVGADLGSLRYKMLPSDRFEELLDGWFAQCALPPLRVTAVAGEVADGHDRAVVRGRTAGGGEVRVRARWVFDSRPAAPPPARTTLLQHFRGWFLRAEHDVFDPGAVTLMDFRTPQPAHGVSFGYVLPWTARDALVEYTEFSPAPLSRAAYDAALAHYTRAVLGVRGAGVTGTEQGVIPMTDAVFPRRTGKRVFRIGAAGGATRPATGYTFAAVQRQTAGIVRRLCAGRTPLPPRPHRRRHRMMDAALLRALDTGRLDGPVYFEQLFAGNPPPRLLRFLDGTSAVREEAAVVLSARSAVLPMLRTAAELPLLPRRPAPGTP